jgi:2-iminobutanoate/2-iminopropanoate deaminase
MTYRTLRCALVVAAIACQSPATTDRPARMDKETFRAPGAIQNLPFSSAVRAGGMLYLSGQVGLSPGTGAIVTGGVGSETRQTLENIKAVLEYAGSSLERVVKCTVFLKDVADYAEMNSAYASYFGAEPPARSMVAGSGLALGASVEIECMALAGT